MKMYLLSIGAGLIVGIVYSLLNVRSPAPPVIALVGLLGILVGEQLIPFAKTLINKEPAVVSWINQIKPHMFGDMPKGSDNAKVTAARNPSIPSDG